MEDHSLITRETIPREFARQFFRTILQSSEDQVASAVDWIERATIPLSLTDCARSLELFAAEVRGIKVSDAESLLQSLFSLEGLRASLNWSGEDLVDYFIRDATEAKELPHEREVSRLRESLVRFFANHPKLERTLKAQRIYDGLLPNYETCSSLVEFRPVFDEGRQEIVNGIISASFMVDIRTEDASTQKISFQLDATDIRQMIAELTRLQRKVTVLKNFVERNVALINPSRSLDSGNG